MDIKTNLCVADVHLWSIRQRDHLALDQSLRELQATQLLLECFGWNLED
jgi:hypothetical protein